MRRFLEKSIVTLLCLFNAYSLGFTKDLVFSFLISLIISFSLDLINNKRYKFAIYIIFLIFIFSNNQFVFYLPLILYNLYLDYKIYSALALPLMIYNFSMLNIFILFISIYLSIKTDEYYSAIEDNKTTRDELREYAISLKRYNEQLKMDRERNIHIAVLTERNRIARELHDSIGHAISSSILQVEALKVVSERNELEGLNLLQDTLQNGMDDIRKSIHNLYNDSFDLENKIQNLFDDIHSINFKFLYKLEKDIDYNLKFDIYTVVREAITNCVKHSNATELRLRLLSQPKFYSVVIEDNGTIFNKESASKGMGLLSMAEVASKYNGVFNYEFDKGFNIRLILMKGEIV